MIAVSDQNGHNRHQHLQQIVSNIRHQHRCKRLREWNLVEILKLNCLKWVIWFYTGQSLSSFVTVTNKLGDEWIVVFGGWMWVSMHKRNYDSFLLYWWRVSMYKRNHIENDVVMVATESQMNFTWSMAIFKELLTNLRSYLWLWGNNESEIGLYRHIGLFWDIKIVKMRKFGKFRKIKGGICLFSGYYSV